ncbi:MAG TPA: DNA-binding protein [Planctomycetota bacterium]|nr:DNA-binding protein [Planctomycetota bacterium]
MTLENLLRTGQLKAHAADEREILRLLDSAQLALKDAAVADLSGDSRLNLAYRALVQAALAAVLANGYRPSTSEPGHHQLLLQTLPKTIGLASERVRVLEAFRKARNQNDYRGIPVSDATARECAEEARRLLADVRAWLEARRAPG